MPRGDRTGPAGMGPQTGRGMGLCSGYATPGYMNPAPGFGGGMGWGRGGGFGRGRGMGRGLRMGWANYAYGPAYPANPQDEKSYLKNEAQALQNQLNAVQQRLSQLESDQAK